ncbi:hypothetical protein J6590_107010 [Homalodisca vitripennis]|nr:hypothetical protein J6590_107010 [Homalodisca vitripennis]
MEPFRTEVAISRMYRVCQECSGFIGTARLCPHSFSPPVTITPLKTNGRSSCGDSARLSSVPTFKLNVSVRHSNIADNLDLSRLGLRPLKACAPMHRIGYIGVSYATANSLMIDD